MPLDKAEIQDLLYLLHTELYNAYKNDGKITAAEWAQIAQKVGVQAFQDVID